MYVQAYLIILHYALFCFTKVFFFNKSKGCANPILSKTIGIIFPKAFFLIKVYILFF